MSESAAEKSEEATPRKLLKAREQGQVAKSDDLAGALSLLVGLLATMALVPWFARSIAGLMLAAERSMEQLDHAALKALWFESLQVAALASLAPLLIASAVHLFSLWLQTGTILSLDPLKPKLERMNPAAGFKRLMSMKTVVKLAQMLLKTAIVGAAVAIVCVRVLPDAIRVVRADAGAAIEVAGSALMHLMLWCGGLFVLMGAADLGYQRWQFLRDQRMSLDEVRREHREDEGDPHVKSARKQSGKEMPWDELIGYMRYASVVVTHQDGRLVALIYRPAINPAPLFLLRARGSQGQQAAEAARKLKVKRMADDALLEAIFPRAVTGEPTSGPSAARIIAFLERAKS